MKTQHKLFVFATYCFATIIVTTFYLYREDSEESIGLMFKNFEDECPAPTEESLKKRSIGCQIPELEPFHPAIMRYIYHTDYPNCTGTTYGVLWNGTLKFTDPNVVSATYRPILRVGDFDYGLGVCVPVGINKITHEMIEVDFQLKNGQVVKDFLLQVLPHKRLLQRKRTKKTGIPLNILILGLDSLSTANTQRKLPKLYDFLKNNLGAYFFKGHSVVGDGTTEQLTAMLTGKYVGEQYEARIGRAGAKPVDGWNWIFKDLKEHGYLTGLCEDYIFDGAFQYRLKGFTNPPTDFYPRPFFLDIVQRTKESTDHCINNRNVPQISIEYVRTVFDMFPKKLKFFFSFNGGYSHHGLNAVKKHEPAMLALLKDFKVKGYLDNTLLIVMGDHGLRFGEMRKQVQGKLEERLPLFSMVFPPWFVARYPNITKVLKTNTDRLTSWFDVYATFRHILSYPDLPRNLTRGVSLFTEVPTTRTCEDAGIADHWCPCLYWVPVDIKHSHIQKSARAVVEFMNDLMAKDNASAALCAKLSLKNVTFAEMERPNEAIVNKYLEHSKGYRQSKEYFCRYQVQFVTSPNEGVFEASVKYHTKRYIVNADISRINQYGEQPKCIAASLPHVTKYCLCKDYKGPL